MKRDARIGLAVVLMLGLGVTLLVGRALYRHGGSSSDLDGDQLALSDGTLKNGSADLGATPVDASAPRDDIRTTTPVLIGGPQEPNTGSVPPNVQGFIQDQSNPIPPRNPGVASTGPKHSNAGEADDSTNAQPTTHGKKIEASSSEFFAYTVTTGDSPWTISSKVFGDGKYTQKIVEANDLTAKKMKPGMTLKIPAIAGKAMVMKLQPYSETGAKSATHDSKPAPANTTAGAGHAAAPTPKSGGYKVETGDTLASIAKKHYGSSGPKTIQLIVTANHGLDPAKLKVGQEIALPTVKQN